MPQGTGRRHLVSDCGQVRIGRAAASLTPNVERRRYVAVQDGVRRRRSLIFVEVDVDPPRLGWLGTRRRWTLLFSGVAALPLDVLNMGVGAREKQALVTTVGPAHEVGAAAVRSDLQDLAVSNRPVQRARGHHDPIADLRLHRVLLSVSVNRAVRPTGTAVLSRLPLCGRRTVTPSITHCWACGQTSLAALGTLLRLMDAVHSSVPGPPEAPGQRSR